LIPPIAAQKKIVLAIEHSTAYDPAAISRLEEEIELLLEYRERLVADVVTGKLDVRDVAARLPVETIEPADPILNTDELADTPELDEEEVQV
jgi:type I restriction enzyme S subunit